jgi:hypothetical protein
MRRLVVLRWLTRRGVRCNGAFGGVGGERRPAGGLGGVDAGGGGDAAARTGVAVRGDAVRLAASAALPPARRVDHRVARPDGAPVRRVHRGVAVGVAPGAGGGVDRPGWVGAFDGALVSGRAGGVLGVRVRSPLRLGRRVRTAGRSPAGAGGGRVERRGARGRLRGPAGAASADSDGVAGVLRRCRRPGRAGSRGGPEGVVGGVPGRDAVQGVLRVRAAPPGGGDARRHRLHAESGRAAAGPGGGVPGALRQGDARLATAAAGGAGGDAVGWAGAGAVPRRGAAALRRGDASGAVVDRAGRADFHPAGR